MNNALSYLNRATDEAKRNGAEYIGSVLNLSVSILNNSKSLPLNDVRNAILRDPLVPDDWAPDPLNPVSIYLRLLTELSSKALNSFRDCGAYIDEEKFGGYIIKRLNLSRADDVVTTHRAYFTKKVVSSVEDNQGVSRMVNDIEIEHSIVLTLRRTVGTVESDLDGDSVFQIEVDWEDCPLDFQSNFSPLILTAHTLFEKRQNGIYEASQVRELFLKVIHHHVHADTLSKGLYFVYKDKIDGVAALSRTLKGLDRGISLINIPISKHEGQSDSVGNETFSQVSQAVSESLLNDLSGLLSELKAFDEGETKTRAGTWDNRADVLQEFNKKYSKYRNKQLLVDDTIDEVIKQCSKIIVKNI